MAYQIDRRRLLLTGAFGLGAFALGGAAAAQALLNATGFTHNVASGEPGPESILLWTRYVAPHRGDAELTVELSESADFVRARVGGVASAKRADDHTARLVVRGLQPGRLYHYRFIAPDGTLSPVGRARTLPVGAVERFTLGVFSCANMPYGWFNAYAHAAARDDIDLMVHLGDYIYEYPRGVYPGAERAVADRVIEPATEAIHLTDYRLRYASYRLDPDLQRLHQQFSMIAQHDDHEIANNAWRDGAENHNPGEGSYAARKRAAIKAYYEWLPVSGEPWTQYDIGALATIFRPETRLVGRSPLLDLHQAIAGGGDPVETLRALRDGPLQDPTRSLMGRTQERWLYQAIDHSKRRGAKWQVVAQQVVMGNLRIPQLPPALLAGLTLPPDQAGYFRVIDAASKVGLPPDLDGWAGFPAARARLLQAAQAADADLVVLSGDSHNAWAFDLPNDGRSVGVEFAGHSVSSPGLEAYLTVPPAMIAQFIRSASPDLQWVDTSNRGYMTVELTPEKASAEWVFMQSVATRSTATQPGHRMAVNHGSRTLAM